MTRRHFTLSLVAASTLWLAGCATGPAQPGVYVENPLGTEFTYLRKSSGSYGAADGPVHWKLGSAQWQGRTVVASVSPEAGSNLLDPASHALVATLNIAGKPVNSFEPGLGFHYPMVVGQTWTDKHQLTLHARGQTLPYEVRYTVEAYESVTVPAGTFMAFRVATLDSFGEKTVQWTAPALGINTVKRILERPPTYPSGAGQLVGELQSFAKPR